MPILTQRLALNAGKRKMFTTVFNDDHIRMLYVYAKGSQGNLTQKQLKALKVIVERW